MSAPLTGWRTFAYCLALVCMLPGQAYAQEAFDVDLKLAAGFWTRNMQVPKDTGVTASSLTGGVTWLQGQTFSARFEAFAQMASGTRDNSARADVRRGYLAFDQGKVALRIGRQVEAWGRADRLNPTDHLSPRDYTTLSTKDDDQRLGLGMARVDLVLSETARLSAYWIPEFRPNELLVPPPALPKVHSIDHRNRQFALKLDRTGGAVDWSLSYYEGGDRVYDFEIASGAPELRYNRIRAFGADLAANLGPFGYRAEVAYFDTNFDSERDALVRRPEVWLVTGLDRSFASNTYLNLQLSVRRVFEFDTPIPDRLAAIRAQVDALRFQQARQQLGFTANLRHSWDDRRWSAELTALHYVDQAQGLVRFELQHQLSARLTLLGRVQRFYGATGSYFQRISEASSVCLELRAVIR